MLRVAETIRSLGFLNGELRSHPEKRLVKHLRGVAVLCEKMVEAYRLPIELQIIKDVAYTHDLGKAHPSFQAYLDKKGLGVNHAEPSSWFTYLLTHNLWAAEVVRRHHTYLRNVDDLAIQWMPDEITLDSITKMLYEYLPDWPLSLTNKDWQELDDLFFDGPEMSISHWFETRLLYSLLIAADRMDAIGIEEFMPDDIPAFLPLSFTTKNKLDKWRARIRQQCLEQAELIDGPGVYTLTLPTGAGKTLLGLEIADQWLKRFNYRTIIYALPFISIVEQNAEKAKEVFGMIVQEDHSISYTNECQQIRNEQNEDNWAKMLVLFRYWREPVVVTTMVQLWETLYNTTANKSMNFHKLSQAVVILDEPQSISPRLWQGLSDTLNYLSDRLGTTFLFMTATQPQIKALAELAPKGLVFPFERHRYLVKSEKYDIKDLQALLEENLSFAEGSGLVVLNTKRAAIEAYQTLKKMVGDAPVLFLSAWMTPWHRKKTLRLLRILEEKKIRRYLVATQVVEAGVDLDFDWVFRDIGPLDSIVQVAGRCNRHLKRTTPGKVLIAELMSRSRSYAAQVYNDGITIPITKKILPRDVEFGEREATILISTYYNTIIKDGLKSVPIYEELAKGKWENVPSLIEEQAMFEINVIIEHNLKVRKLYEELQNHKWSLENRHEQKQLYQELQQYVIKIPGKSVPSCRRKMEEIFTRDTIEPFADVFDGSMFYLTRDGIRAGLYDKRIGFMPPDNDQSGGIIID